MAEGLAGGWPVSHLTADWQPVICPSAVCEDADRCAHRLRRRKPDKRQEKYSGWVLHCLESRPLPFLRLEMLYMQDGERKYADPRGDAALPGAGQDAHQLENALYTLANVDGSLPSAMKCADSFLLLTRTSMRQDDSPAFAAAEKNLLSALILYVQSEPACGRRTYERSMYGVQKLLEETMGTLEDLFCELRTWEPDSPAAACWNIFTDAYGSLRSLVRASLHVRIVPFVARYGRGHRAAAAAHRAADGAAETDFHDQAGISFCPVDCGDAGKRKGTVHDDEADAGTDTRKEASQSEADGGSFTEEHLLRRDTELIFGRGRRFRQKAPGDAAEQGVPGEEPDAELQGLE